MKERATRRKWVWRGAAAVLLMLAATAAVPFVFPTATVRFALARSGMKDLPFTFGGATLSPLGSVTLRDVVVADRAAAGKNVATASAVQIGFNWGEVSSGKIREIHVDNAVITVRKGEDVPVTLMRLFSDEEAATPATTRAATGPAATQGASGPASGGPPAWFDRLSISGTVRVEGFERWTNTAQIPVSGLRLDAAVTTSGERSAPVREISLVVGDTEARSTAPVIVGKGRLQGIAAPVLVIDQLTLSNFSPVIPADLAERIAGLPTALTQEYSGRLERLQLAGRVMWDREPTIALTAEMRDLSLHGSGHGEGKLAVGVEHLSVGTRLEGRWPAVAASPLKDVLFNATRVSWETLQVGDARITRGVADLQNDGMEVVLTDLQATVDDVTLAATAAYDINNRNVTRARVYLSNIDVARSLDRLPASLRQVVPGRIEGTVAARIFMTELDKEHVAARVEVASPERLTFVGNAPASTAPATAPASGGVAPLATLTNLNTGATVSWNMRPDTLPEVMRGRLTADRLDLSPPDGSPPVTAVRIISDFSLSRGTARLNDLYASFADGANLYATATYTIGTQALESSRVTLGTVDASLINPWLPGEWNLGGKFDSEVQVTLKESNATVIASVTLSPDSSVQYGKVVVGVTGAPVADVPSPSVAIKALADLRSGVWTVESLTPRGFGSIHTDAASVQALRDLLKPAEGSGMDRALSRVKEGASVAFDDLAFSGRVEFGAAPRANTTVHVSNLSFTAPAASGQESGLSGLNLHGTAEAPLDAAAWLSGLRVSDATIQAQRFVLGGNVVSNFTGSLSAEGGKAAAKDLAFTYADGTFTGSVEAGLAPEPAVEGMELKFRTLNQAAVTAALYPDRFTAEGPISGTMRLRRARNDELAGSIVIDSELPGVLKISRETSESTFAQAAKAAASAEGSIIPSNFDKIVVDQLANYPYATGHAELRDSPRGLEIQLKYDRVPLKPGDPGYSVPVVVAGQTVNANLEFNLGGSVTVNNSIANLLKRVVGAQNVLIPKMPATAPASAPATATAPATTRP